ncbi:MAG: efflux RND transporter periplasmic adaptor subunit [Marinobacter sp.]
MNIFTRILLSAAALTVTGCINEAPESPETAAETPEVTVDEIQAWQGAANQKLPGVVRPGKRAALSTRIAGTLLSVEVEPGDRVETGDLLATVDAREVDAAIAATRAKISASEAAVEQVRLDSQRLQRLYEEDLIARVRVEQVEVKHQELKAQLQAGRSELQAQQANLSYTRLTAPFTGLVAETLVDAGSFVGPGQPLLILEARERLRVDVPVSSHMAASLIPGQRLSVITGPDQTTLPAYLTSVVPALGDEGTGQRLRLTLDADSDQLAPGQVVSVLVPNPDTAQRPQNGHWVGLPKAALIRRGQLTGTLVIEQSGDGPAVHLKWIKTTTTPDNGTDLIPVTQGLSVGDKVVLNPSAKLQDGQSVTVKSAGPDYAEE